AAVCRRADGESRQHDGRRGSRLPAPGRPRVRADGGDGHPRPGCGTVRRRGDHHARREDCLMRSVLLASLRLHTRRYVAAATAVFASVAFVVVIGVLTAGTRQGLMDGFGAPFRNADVIVDAVPVEAPLPTAIALELVERLGDDASGLGRVFLPARTDSWDGAVALGPVAPPALRWQELVAGRFPEREAETVVHIWTANEHEIE